MKEGFFLHYKSNLNTGKGVHSKREIVDIKLS
jgi:hypothetical protein